MQLVINTFGASLTRNGELFVIKIDGRKVEIAAKKITSLLITTSVHFSSDTLLLASEYNIDVVLLDKYGKPFGRFWDGKMGSTAAIRRAQLVASENQLGLDIVKSWTITKLTNQKKLLNELLRRRAGQEALFEPALQTISTSIANIENVSGKLDELRNYIMGVEGHAAAAYWRVIGQLPPAEFAFSKRSQHPGVDPVNAMLNYAYGVLYSKVERACIIAGLDPQLGFLHADNYNRKSLVFDMIEPFRHFADRIVIKLFTGRRCHKTMFHFESSGAIILQKAAKELLINALNEFLDASVRYKIKSSKTGKTRQIKRLNTIQAEAHSIANRLLNKTSDDIPEIVNVIDLDSEH